MSLDHDEIDRLARPGRAFSNSTEWECWSYNWCERCLRDAPFRNMGKGSGCPIILVAMLGEKTPAEWLEQPRDEEGRYSLTDRYHCIEAKFPGDGGSGEPRPKPEPPLMDGLFERPARGTRMYVQPQPQWQTAGVS